MRKLLRNSLFVLLTLVASAAWADVITGNQAREFAADYIEGGAANARMLKSKGANINQPIYIFSRGEGKGFVVMSGDDCMPRVLLYTEAGDYNEEEMPDVLKDIISHYENVIIKAQEDGTNRPLPVGAPAYDKNIAPLMSSWWSQGAPYNNLCPMRKDGGGHALTGCVATASSQIAYYWRNECYKTVQYNTPTYSWGDAPVTTSIEKGTPYNWELMKDNGGATAAGNTAMATLNVVIGTSAYLSYGASTGGYIWKAADALKGQVGLTYELGKYDYGTWENQGRIMRWKYSYDQTTWEAMMINDLSRGYPILYSGYDANGGGHAFVMDGYRTKDNMFHINLGWGKSYDAYCAMNDGPEYVAGWGVDQGMVCGIHPINSSRVYDIKLSDTNLYSTVPVKLSYRIVNGSDNVMHGAYIFGLAGASTVPTPESLDDAIFAYEKDLTLDDVVEGEIDWACYTRGGYAKIYVTDNNLNILYESDKFVLNRTRGDLEILNVAMDNVSDVNKETVTVDGKEVELSVGKIKTDDFAYMNAKVSNQDEAGTSLCTPIMPQIRGVISKLQDGTFVEIGRVNNETVFQANEVKDLKIKFDELEQDVIYKVNLYPTAGTFKKTTGYNEQNLVFNNPDSVAYFKLAGSTMNVVEDSSVVKFSGVFDPVTYSEYVVREDLCVFDLSNLEAYDAEFQRPANKNALLVCNALQGVTGKNVIVDGVCEELELVQGYDFNVPAKFNAKKAKLVLKPSVDRLGVFVLPFDAPVANGMIASSRELAYTFTSYQVALKAGTPYTYIAGRDIDVVAENVDVDIPGENIGYEEFVPTYKSIKPEGKFGMPSKKGMTFEIVTDEKVQALSAYCSETRFLKDLEVSDIATKSHELFDSLVVAYNLQKELYEKRSVQANETFQKAIDEAENTLTTVSRSTTLGRLVKTFASAIETYRNEPETAVDVINEQKTKTDVIYDVTGRAVKTMQDGGIYILNGKKYLK